MDLSINAAKKGKVRIRFERVASENNLYTIQSSLTQVTAGCCAVNDVFIKFYRPQDAYLSVASASQIPSTA
jgi:hypothetical protein